MPRKKPPKRKSNPAKRYKIRLTQYCKKHDQKYASYLRECPICVGEKLALPIESRLILGLAATNHPDKVVKKYKLIPLF